jgi:hypothetical protein
VSGRGTTGDAGKEFRITRDRLTQIVARAAITGIAPMSGKHSTVCSTTICNESMCLSRVVVKLDVREGASVEAIEGQHSV